MGVKSEIFKSDGAIKKINGKKILRSGFEPATYRWLYVLYQPTTVHRPTN